MHAVLLEALLMHVVLLLMHVVLLEALLMHVVLMTTLLYFEWASDVAVLKGVWFTTLPLMYHQKSRMNL